MTKTEFRANPVLVKEMRQIFENEAFLIAWDIMLKEGPITKREQGDANRILGRIEGYDEFPREFLKFGDHPRQANVDNDEVV